MSEMPFLDHVAELRKHLIRAIIGLVIAMIIVGVLWSYIIDIIMAPLSSEFITFRGINALGNVIGVGDIFQGPFDIQNKLKNLQFGGQFSSMIGVLLVSGLIVGLPYIVYEFFEFLKPGLTQKEKEYSNFLMLSTVLFFLLGVTFAYFLVLPLSVHFMFFFQPFEVENNWTIMSYVNVFVQTTLAMGVVFLLPIVVFFLAKINLVTPAFMITYRKHAFVVILTVAAIITPADLLSMFIASVPLLLLYEFSILIVKRVYKEEKKTDLIKPQ
ncbi:twin-arginine translocase subunit TatC [Flavobacteriaceae bacterium Ap0902]|nr:twin-arginine translocase subunit TatC [Flavobacteriaceae bacterium Ap0902]